MGTAVRQATSDPAEVVARVAVARRELLLRAHRRRLRFEDLEDCYSQATLELVVRSRRSPFANADHVKNALEQKFVSRINDRRRALAGRSGIEAAIANAVSVDAAGTVVPEIEDRAAAVERHVEVSGDIRRLREVMAELSFDQRLVLHSQVNLQMDVREFCERYGWSTEKFRKVAQRARTKLRALVAEYQSGERCRRLEPDLIAMLTEAGADDQRARARMHVQNCPACARYAAAQTRAARKAAAVLPMPAAATIASRAKLAWMGGIIRRILTAARHPVAEMGTGGAAGFTSGSTAGLVIGKATVVAICIASAAGGYAVCERIGSALSPTSGAIQVPAHPFRSKQLRHDGVLAPAGRARAAPGGRSLSTAAQIRREFGLGRSHVATAGAQRVASPPASSGDSLAAQPLATVRQEATEFGFER